MLLNLFGVDIVVSGQNVEFHIEHARKTVEFHGRPASTSHGVLHQAQLDVETYFLGPSGHQLWRGGLDYRDFPFRKVLSLQTYARTNDLLLPNL